MSGMIERVAEALWQEESIRATGWKRRETWGDVSSQRRKSWVGLARAAIEAVREPTDKMRTAGYEELDLDQMFTAMIDAALNEDVTND